MSDGTVVRSTCWGGPGCDAGGCGLLLHVKDGRVVKAEGDPDSPDTRGRLCPRILALTQYIYHPDRLKQPLKRIGLRGEGKWQAISWEEAYDVVVEKLNDIKRKHGPESVLFCQGTGRDIMCWISRLAYSYGSPNWSLGSLSGESCYIPRLAASLVTYGGATHPDLSQQFKDRYDNPSWQPPKYLVIWGKNPVYTYPDGFHGYWVFDAMKRGTKLIVIDPRLTWLAARADLWLQIRPGTDAALALGMLNVIINEGLYDEEFVEKWCYGFDKLRERVQEYSAERAAEITWVPAEKIRQAARLYATNKPSAICEGVGIDQQIGGVQASLSINSLIAITGNLEVPGGNIILQPPFGVYQMWTGGWGYDELLTEEQKQKRIGLKEFPLLNYGFLFSHSGISFEQTVFTGEPYPIKGMWIQTTNMLSCMANDPKRALEALKNVDFIANVDLFMTPTGMYADVVLPAASVAEKNSLNAIWTNLSVIPRAIEPVGQCKSDQEIVLELGKRLNPAAWPWDNVEEMLDSILASSGYTFASLREEGYAYPEFRYRKHEKGLLRSDNELGFNSPTGHFELYSTMFEDLGYDPLPYHIEPPESPLSTPELYGEYPLVMTSGSRSPVFTHSELRQVPWLREVHPEPLVEMHPDTAKTLGIEEGEWVWIETRRGRCKQKAKLTLGIDPRVIHAQHGWWFPEKPAPEPSLFGNFESNINVCVPAITYGPQGYGAPYRSSLCKVYPVKEAV